MKSEERHELAQNDLEVALEKARTKFREIAEVHGNRILLWLSAVLLLIAAWIYYSRTTTTANTEGWTTLMNAQNAEELAGLADSYEGTPVGQLARLRVAEQYLQTGIQLMFSDREAAVTELEEANAAFSQLLNNSDLLPEVEERALFGMARTQESLAEGDFEACLATYNKLLEEYPDSVYREVVEKRIARLKKENAQSFYAWFAKQSPEPKDMEQPQDMLKGMNLEGMAPGNMPPGGATPPTGNLPTPEAGEESETPEGESSVPSTPGFPPPLTTPGSDDGEKGAADMPAEPNKADSPAESGEEKAEPKATEETSGEKKPTDEKPESADSKEEPTDKEGPSLKPAGNSSEAKESAEGEGSAEANGSDESK